MSQERACKICGCTETKPCVLPGGPCGWAAENVCTFCAAKLALKEDRLHFCLDGVRAVSLFSLLQTTAGNPELGPAFREFAQSLAELIGERLVAANPLVGDFLDALSADAGPGLIVPV